MSIRGPLIKLIIFTIISVFVTLLVAVTIGASQFGSKHEYHALVSNVTGLLPGDDVRVAGVLVGRVDGVSAKNGVADVTFSVDSDVRLPQNVLFEVRYKNLIGQRYISLVEQQGNSAFLKPGDTIPLKDSVPPLDLDALFNGFKPLFVALTPHDINQFAGEIISVLQGEGGTVDQLLAHTASLTDAVATRDAEIGAIISNLNTVVGTIAGRGQALGNLVGNLQRFATNLAADRQTLSNSIGAIDDLAASSAKLLHDIRPGLDPDLYYLNNVLGTLVDNKANLDKTLKMLPGLLNHWGRAMSYGTWLNVYVCDFVYRDPTTGLSFDLNGNHTQSVACR